VSSLRSVVAGIASNDRLGPLLASTGIGRGLVQRVAGGEAPGDAMASIHDLADSGRFVSLERHWGAASSADLDSVVADYESIIELLGAAGIGSIAEINVPSAFLTVPRGPEALNEVCAIARDAGVGILVTTGASGEIDACIAAVRRQRAIGRDVGIGLQTSLRRTERDCAEMGGRVRLVKEGTAAAPAESGRFDHSVEVDKSFVRCAKVLLARGEAVEPSFATHDPRLVEIVQALAGRYQREPRSYEFAMYLGRAEHLQQRLVDAGEHVRVFVPFGPEWFGRLVGGLAKRPSGLASAVRVLLPGA
jgi:proline dehydrogenase